MPTAFSMSNHMQTQPKKSSKMQTDILIFVDWQNKTQGQQ